MKGAKEQIATLYAQSNRVATEAISNIKTVATLRKEEMFFEQFQSKLEEPYRSGVSTALRTSLGLGIAQAMQFYMNAFTFFIGGKFVASGLYTGLQLLSTFFAVLFTAQQAGQASSFAPNIAKARVAAATIFEFLDRIPRIDSSSAEGKKPKAQGNFEGSGMEFSYPTRSDTKVLKGLDVRGLRGQTIALVGPSGCGKSTVIALLERFYDVSGGSMNVEGVDTREWHLQTLRKEMALVGQEPILFSGSIRENIAYGVPDSELEPSQEQIETVARMANIHDFIMTQPQGYHTEVGEKGGQLSGGQKQRVAIARALIRNPEILLLDEATSALDSESEKVVELALKVASKGRTTVSIAHRLSTIQDADVIFVINRGAVVEWGKHMDLIEQKGQYFELVNQQRLGAAP
ncbi:hypothetical protein HDU93_001319 [Gonapodya sp. JEL0774]|nr:hypothetical protein HDU93_001319 [Gonapodya sp. JEL0774]